ncbi:3,4-dihydroxy-2-butanone-4-phosphate synthase [Nocardia sp. NPDC051900]|uniref:3,4-dihydroxy-2-butanone-4-phosphate synthase n=1 Tax=Nocardia sp. NPDC051900 TaxID=3364326 RepID=UPI0037998BAA
MAAIRQGKPVILVDTDRDVNGGDLVFAAEQATQRLVAFAIRHGSGFLCVAMTEPAADRLDLPALVIDEDPCRPGYAVSVDARDGTTTGISAADRALTMRMLADPRTDSSALSRPGHIVPLRISAAGVLRHPGAAEAAVDLAVLAGLKPAAALCKLVSENDPRELAQGSELRRFAQEHHIPILSIAELADHRLRNSTLVTPATRTAIQLAHGTFTAVSYCSIFDERRHIALIMGTNFSGSVPVRIQRECVIGDVFGSPDCDCAESTNHSLAEIASAGDGVLIYLRRPENATILGHDPAGTTVKYQLPQDIVIAAGILRNLGLRSVHLIAPRAGDAQALARLGVPVDTREA